MKTENTPTLNTAEAADYLNLKKPTLDVWRHLGKGPRFVKLGRAVRYRMSDLDTYLVSATRQSTSEQAV